ncbi:hypothetical protein ACKVMT_01315 [Halobacteriales archaeon Cl-PHB]
MPASRTRRQVLRAGALGVVGLAGCPGPAATGVRLVGVRAENFTRDTQTVGVTVTDAGEVVHESTVDVPGVSETADGEQVLGATFVDCTWDATEAGSFVVNATLEASGETTRLGADDVTGCHWASVRVDAGLTAHWNDCEPYEGEGHLCHENSRDTSTQSGK